MRVACASETNAPVAGLPSTSAKSRSQKLPAAAVSAADAAKETPPTTMRSRRREVSPTTPISGSSVLPTKPGIARTSPISG